MAHMLESIDSMVYVGDRPWHNWGVKLADDATLQAACEALPMLLGQVDYRPVSCDLGPVPDHFAVVLTSPTGEQRIVGAGGKQLAQSGTSPARLIQTAANVAPLGMDNPIATAGFVFGRSRMFLSMPLGERNIATSDKDTVKYFLNLSAGFDGSWSLIGQIASIRMVCYNTANASRRALGADKADRKVKATRNFSIGLEKAETVWTDAIKEYQGVADIYDRLAATKVNDEEAKRLLSQANGVNPDKLAEASTRAKNTIDKLFDLYQTGQGSDLACGTLWGVYNAVTEYADHHSIVRGGRDSTGNVEDFGRVLGSTLFGSAQDLKAVAFNTVCEAMDRKQGETVTSA